MNWKWWLLYYEKYYPVPDGILRLNGKMAWLPGSHWWRWKKQIQLMWLNMQGIIDCLRNQLLLGGHQWSLKWYINWSRCKSLDKYKKDASLEFRYQLWWKKHLLWTKITAIHYGMMLLWRKLAMSKSLFEYSTKTRKNHQVTKRFYWWWSLMSR